MRDPKSQFKKLLKESEPTGARIERLKVPNDPQVAYNNSSYNLSPSLTCPPTSRAFLPSSHSTDSATLGVLTLKRDVARQWQRMFAQVDKASLHLKCE